MDENPIQLGKDGPIVVVVGPRNKFGVLYRVKVEGMYNGTLWKEGTLLWADETPHVRKRKINGR